MTAPLCVRSIPYRDPVRAFAPFAGDPVAALLDSADDAGGRGRFSYIAADPFRVIAATNAGVTVDGAPVEGDPFTVLDRELARFRLPTSPGLPAFQTGAVGFLGYELGRHLERLPPPRPDDMDLPEMLIGLYDTIAAFDVRAGHAWVMAADVTGREGRLDRPPAVARADAMAAVIADAADLNGVDWAVTGCWRAETPRADYEAAVARVVEYIFAGDIFQANVTQRFLAALPAGLDPFTLYRRLRELNPAPFAAYLTAGAGRAVVSASPERFLRLDAGGAVETRPIKGTRPRGRTADEDSQLAAELIASEKDRAENLMIVDLLRNDLSRVCRPGSIRVADLLTLETFANVHHLVSGITGRMGPGLGAVDLLRATFPGGSVTGAPKIRAMEIINALEPARRGPYCGAIAWIGFDGAMESSIVIRTLTVGGGRVAAQAGGGIVADSDPALEYDETITKARQLLAALDPRGTMP